MARGGTVGIGGFELGSRQNCFYIEVLQPQNANPAGATALYTSRGIATLKRDKKTGENRKFYAELYILFRDIYFLVKRVPACHSGGSSISPWRCQQMVKVWA